MYCYATSYIRFKGCKPKERFLRNLARDLAKAEVRVVNMSTSSDPYPPMEAELKLTRQALILLAEHGFPVLITTKSSLVARDKDVLSRMKAAVSITITTLDETLARRIEPGAPPPRDRLRAVEELSKSGVPVAVRVDPVIPFLNDDPRELEELVEAAASVGAVHVTTSTYKARPDNLYRMCREFPELADKWRSLYSTKPFHGYRYLPADLRRKLLEPVRRAAERLGLTYATCREGEAGFRNAPSCDGSHLCFREQRPT